MGIALEQTEQRVRLEILHFLRLGQQSADTLHTLSDWVWNRTCWVLGGVHPYFPGLPPDVQSRLQIEFLEEMAKRGIADIVKSLAGAPEPIPKTFLVGLAGKLTGGKMRHANEIRSKKQAFMMEIAGVLDVYRDDISGALAVINGSKAVAPADVEAEVAAIKELFRTGKAGRSLPFFNTQAGLHAMFRWNRAQQLKPNEYLDYYHAAALPYFDIFLTEKILASTVATLGYDELYCTRVCSGVGEALDALGMI
jgi:hypothetical protein